MGKRRPKDALTTQIKQIIFDCKVRGETEAKRTKTRMDLNQIQIRRRKVAADDDENPARRNGFQAKMRVRRGQFECSKICGEIKSDQIHSGKCEEIAKKSVLFFGKVPLRMRNKNDIQKMTVFWLLNTGTHAHTQTHGWTLSIEQADEEKDIMR